MAAQLHTHKFAEEQVQTAPRKTAEGAVAPAVAAPTIDELLSAFQGAQARIVEALHEEPPVKRCATEECDGYPNSSGLCAECESEAILGAEATRYHSTGR